MLRADGDERLVGSQHMWRYAAENLPAKYEDDFEALRASGLKTARAWALKESLRDLWGQRSRAAGERWWTAWYSWAVRSRLAPVKKVAAMVKRHLPNVLTYFKHRITNAHSVRSRSRATCATVLPSFRTRRTEPARNSSVNCRRARFARACFPPIVAIVSASRGVSTGVDQAEVCDTPSI